MTKETDQEDDIALAAEYVLGLLTPAEAEAFEAHLEVSPELLAEYARWATELAAMAEAIPAVVPPKSMKRMVNVRLFGVENRTFWQRMKLFPGLLGGLVTAALVFAAVNLGLLTIPGIPESTVYRSEIAAENGSLVVLASYDPAAGVLRVERETGSAREGRVLELWFIAQQAAPVSLGVLPEGQSAEVTLSQNIVDALEGAVLAISDEPTGGSPTGVPTGEVLATGELTTL